MSTRHANDDVYVARGTCDAINQALKWRLRVCLYDAVDRVGRVVDLRIRTWPRWEPLAVMVRETEHEISAPMVRDAINSRARSALTRFSSSRSQSLISVSMSSRGKLSSSPSCCWISSLDDPATSVNLARPPAVCWGLPDLDVYCGSGYGGKLVGAQTMR